MTVGEKIRQIRESQGMTLEEVGNLANMSRQRVQQLEVSKTIPTIPALQNLAKGLHCSLLDLIIEPLGLDSNQRNSPCVNSNICPFYKKA